MERYLARMVELLDIQQQNCINMGAKADYSMEKRKRHSKAQRKAYFD